MNLFILDVSTDKKEITVVRSERFLFNLVPHDLEILGELQKIFTDFRVYEVEEKYFRDAENTMDNYNLIL